VICFLCSSYTLPSYQASFFSPFCQSLQKTENKQATITNINNLCTPPPLSHSRPLFLCTFYSIHFPFLVLLLLLFSFFFFFFFLFFFFQKLLNSLHIIRERKSQIARHSKERGYTLYINLLIIILWKNIHVQVLLKHLSSS